MYVYFITTCQLTYAEREGLMMMRKRKNEGKKRDGMVGSGKKDLVDFKLHIHIHTYISLYFDE